MGASLCLNYAQKVILGIGRQARRVYLLEISPSKRMRVVQSRPCFYFVNGTGEKSLSHL